MIKGLRGNTLGPLKTKIIMKKFILLVFVFCYALTANAQRYMEDSDVYLLYGAKKDTIKKSPTDTAKWFYDGFTVKVSKYVPESGFMFKKPMDITQIKYASECPCNISSTCKLGVYYFIYYSHIINEGGVIKLKTDSTQSKRPTGFIDSLTVDWKNVVAIWVTQDGGKKFANCYIVDGCYFMMKIQGYAFDSTGFPPLAHVVPTVKDATPLTVGTKSAVLNNITFYPNPTTDLVNFSQQVTSVEVCNMNGTVILTASFVNQVDLSTLAPGTYILKITDSFGNTDQQQIVKQ